MFNNITIIAMYIKGHLLKEYVRYASAIFVLILLPAIFMLPANAYAKKNKIPYGSSCYDSYGAKGHSRSISYAIEAARKYFDALGYNVKLVGHIKHFMTIEVYDDMELIDTIIVDIRSGKMRSVE